MAARRKEFGFRFSVFGLLVLFSTLISHLSPAHAQGTAFTYQGSLQTTNGAGNGLYDFTFTLFAAESGGAPLTATVADSVPVSNGLFTATVDFLSAAWFNGDDRWLEITVRTNGGVESPVTISPRQEITATPYALHSASAGIANSVAVGSVNASSLANGTALAELLDDDGAGSGLDADLLDGLDSTDFASVMHAHYGETWSGAESSGLEVQTSATGTGVAALRGRSGTGALVHPAFPSGVWGESDSGNGVAGTSTSGVGVFGSSRDYAGVQGFGGQIGVLARSDSPTGKGLWAQSFTDEGTSYGAQATAYSPDGTGVLGEHVATNGTAPGVLGRSDSLSALAAGVLGEISSTTPGNNSAAVRGINRGAGGNGIGVWGSHAGSGRGVYGASANGYGVYADSGSGHAIYANGSVDADRLVYNSPRTHYRAVAGDLFMPRTFDSTTSYRSTLGTGGAYLEAGTERLMQAPLNLPDGAVVTGLRAYFYDDSTQTLTARIRRYSPAGFYSSVASVDSAGISGAGDKSVTVSGAAATINNQTLFYTVEALSSGTWSAAGSDLKIRGVVVEYTISEAD